MRLDLWLTERRGRTAALAVELNVSGSLVTQWARGKPIAAVRCLAIDRATAGEVRRWDLRPTDWWLIWPELIGAEGAPAVPAEEVRNAA